MIQFNSRVDRIAKDLQDQIVQGKLKPGERLPSERSLCSVFGVGRTTIREALKSLGVRGLVIRSARGAVVADAESRLLPGADLMEVRVAGWAALRATPDDVDAMRRAIEADIARNTAMGNPSRMFHDALAQAAHNPALVQVYESGRSLFFRLPFYWKLFDDAKVKSVRAARHELARRWHEQIFKAIADHDAAEAEGAMFQHLDIMEKDLLNRLQPADGDAHNQKLYSHPLLTSFESEQPDSSEIIRSTR